jgi:hypothetical protein
MHGTKIVRHQAYEMTCGATPVDGGKFVPTLVLSKQAWPRRPRVIDVPRGDYVSEEVAIDAAYTQGVDWIQNYG